MKILSIGMVVVGSLIVVYIGLIAVVMGYAATTIDFAQSVKNDEAQVATLDAQYFNSITAITNMNYAAAGYHKPVEVSYVAKAPETAMR